ncbi:SDR family NAD(P)-dependent oxidoreductase [Pendulispora brunnea]|uniref:SDR family NAD(P)-dependent oxidoreductase n=1 Tax=Pendulispora brunnea TaxID=2905690 RepID=A0ABZ2KJT8_9BACT
MNLRTTAASYSAIADRYDDESNETSFWGELAREAYENIVISPKHRLVVDVGCGTGLALEHLRGRAPESTRFVGIEPAEQMRQLAKERMGKRRGESHVEIYDGRFEELPLPDASVDYLYSIWAFHWVSDPRRAAVELRRVLKKDADIDLWFVGMNTGREFAQITGEILRKYVDLEARVRAASMMASFDRDLVLDLFSFLDPRGLSVTEETATHHDTLERHWAWQVRSETFYSSIPASARDRFDAEWRGALSELAGDRGIPYTRHSFHVRYRHPDRAILAMPAWFDAAQEARTQQAPRPAFLCALAAGSDEDLRAGAAQLRRDLERERAPLGDVRAVVTGSSSHRAAVAFRDAGGLAQGLDSIARDRVPPLGARGVVKSPPAVAFLFSGQGSELGGSGRELFETCPTFRAGIEACARHADGWLGISLVDVLFRDSTRLAEDTVDKVALFALQYALAHLWRSWGVQPNVVVGHSLGEYAAACVAGVFSLEDALRMVVGRGRIMQEHAGSGAMCAVQASAERIGPYLQRHAGKIVISAFNAPESLVLSGESCALESLARELAADGVKTTPLRTAHAFHSPLMAAAADPLLRTCDATAHAPPRMAFVSTVDGGKELSMLPPEYWVRHMLEPVRFMAAVEALDRRGVSAYVEIGPGATLTNLVAQRLGERGAVCLPSLNGKEDEPWSRLLSGLGTLYAQGVDVNWDGFSVGTAPRTVQRTQPAPDGAAVDSPWLRRLSAASPGDRLQVARRLVREEVESLLGGAVDETRAERTGLMELGLRSVQLVALARRLSERLDQRVSEMVAFSRPNLDGLARFVLESLGLQEDTRPAPTVARETTEDDPIAIIGAGCRLPGGVTDLAGLWSLLEEGRSTERDLPVNRLELAGRASLLDEVADFDADFFGISPREAMRIDPVHRLLLEVCWEALENAAIVPASLAGTQTGLFVGIGPSEYTAAQPQATPSMRADAHAGLGTAPSIGVGRVSYLLGLQGPCLAVDTACSSSLVALHLACQSLRSGESRMALAGGVSLLLSPGTFTWLESSNALAEDGRCKTFSADADGYGRGEGCGVVVLKRLREAQADGDRVLALVRGSAINHDGASSSLTAPNGSAQQALLARALEDARCAASSVGYVEAHGTGTPLGDPIEVEALDAVYGRARDRGAPALLGSVKTNIGHLEYAAGVAGLLKAVLSLQHGRVPAHLHAERLSPHIAWDDVGLAVAREATPWPDWNTPRRAGVSSFGLSGTNAHVIVEEAPAPAAPPLSASMPLPVLLSAKTEAALRAQAARLHAHLEARPELALADVAYSLATARSHFEHRAALVAGERTALLQELATLARGEPSPRAVVHRSSGDGKVVFVFPGQGSQWRGMALGLLEGSAVFREQIAACERAFASHVDWSLLDVLHDREGAPSLERVDVVQPALFAVMVSLAALWRASGVVPDAVVGHSQGEIAAAYVAGALSLEDAAKVVTLRSRALTHLAGKGAMAAVQLGATSLQDFLAPFGDRLAVAAINSPSSTLVSGDPDAVEALLERLAAARVFARRVRVDYASHCAHVDAIEGVLASELAGIAPRPAEIPLYSTVTASRLSGSELDAAYWFRNLRQTVRFAEVVQRHLAPEGHRFFVEVSPHPVLTVALHESLEEREEGCAVLGSLRRDEGELARFLLSFAELHTAGRRIDWRAFFAPHALRRVELPTYAFQRRRFWLGDESAPPLLAAIDWVPVELPAASSGPLPDVVPFVHDGSGHVVSAAHEATARALALLQSWLAGDSASPLVISTRGAVATHLDRGLADLVHAPLWGLVRSAQSENPDRRILLLDTDDSEASRRAFPSAVALGLPQLVLRKGVAFVPRLARVESTSAMPTRFEGTVLITGGTGTLGALLARHLVRVHGVRHLLLASRRGLEADGAEALRRELEELGAHVSIVACDASERASLEHLFSSAATAEHPLRAVIHTAGTLDDGLLTSLTPERLHSVLRAKLDAAVHLHELTRSLDLSAFILFSSLSGVLGGPGQANYAAANAFLDALAHHRIAQGLPALSIDWGFWADRSGMTAHLDPRDLQRMARSGLRPLSADEGLALFDAALARPEPALVAARLDLAALDRAEVRPAVAREALAQQLLALPAEGRERAVLDVVRAQIASVLGLPSANTLEAHRPLQELGLDSLMAVELRNRISSATGLSLQVTLLFAHPTPHALAAALTEKLLAHNQRAAPQTAAHGPILAELDKLEASLAALDGDEAARAQVVRRLKTLLARAAEPVANSGNAAPALDLDSASDEELFASLDRGFGEVHP